MPKIIQIASDEEDSILVLDENGDVWAGWWNPTDGKFKWGVKLPPLPDDAAKEE